MQLYEKVNVLGYTYITKKVHNIKVITNLLLVCDGWGKTCARNKTTQQCCPLGKPQVAFNDV